MDARDDTPNARINRLLEAIERTPDTEAKAHTRALVAAVLDWHKDGLARIMNAARSREGGDAFMGELARDEHVASLLALHGLHPGSALVRARESIDEANRALLSLGARARVIDVDDEQVRVLLSIDSGRGGLAPRMRALALEALEARVPDRGRVVIDVVIADGTLVPVERLRSRSAVTRERIDPTERCESCGAPIDDDHGHLFAPASRTLRCSCDPCALASNGGWKRVPPRAEVVHGIDLTDAHWQRMAIPIGLAFFQRSSSTSRIAAYYPSPAGAVEAAIDDDAWQAVVRDNPALADLSPDVEALLVHRNGTARAHYRVSIDRAYALVGLLRRSWRGLGGGAEAWRDVSMFLAQMEPIAEAAP